MRITMLQLQYKLINYNNIITIKSSLIWYYLMVLLISKTQEGSTYKDSQEKCFTTTNSTAKL